MSNRFFIIFISISLLIAVIGLMIKIFASEASVHEFGLKMFEYGLNISTICGLILLAVNGSFILSKFFDIAKGLLLIIMLGLFLRLNHWTSYANAVMVTGIASILVCYLIHFLKKDKKKRLDLLKLIWVIVHLLHIISSVLSLEKELYLDISYYLLWILIIYFIVSSTRNKTLMND